MSVIKKKDPKPQDLITTMIESYEMGIGVRSDGAIDVIVKLGPEAYALSVEDAETFIVTMQSCIDHAKGDTPSAIH